MNKGLEELLANVKFQPGGRELIEWLREMAENDQVNLDVNTNPNDPGAVGVLMGSIRRTRFILEVLSAEFVGEEEQEES